LIQINARRANCSEDHSNVSEEEDLMMAESFQSNARQSGRKAFASIAQLPDRIMLAIEGWRERSRLRRDLDGLEQRGDLERTLADSGIALSDVPRLMRAHPGSARQLDEMMQRLGLDRDSQPRAAALREMEWQCSACADWRTCRTWLASREAQGDYHAFCPNADVLDKLRGSEITDSEASTTH
jgi:hypothetical protein